jgi:hypothetical protein
MTVRLGNGCEILEFEQNNKNRYPRVLSLSGFDLREGKVQDVCMYELAQIDGSPHWRLYT